MDPRAALAVQQSAQTVRAWLVTRRRMPRKVRAALGTLIDHGEADWQRTPPDEDQEVWACRWQVRFPEGDVTSCTGTTVKEVWREDAVCRPLMDRGERLRLDIQRAAIEIAQLPVLGQCVEQDRVIQILSKLVSPST